MSRPHPACIAHRRGKRGGRGKRRCRACIHLHVHHGIRRGLCREKKLDVPADKGDRRAKGKGLSAGGHDGKAENLFHHDETAFRRETQYSLYVLCMFCARTDGQGRQGPGEAEGTKLRGLLPAALLFPWCLGGRRTQRLVWCSSFLWCSRESRPRMPLCPSPPGASWGSALLKLVKAVRGVLQHCSAQVPRLTPLPAPVAVLACLCPGAPAPLTAGCARRVA